MVATYKSGGVNALKKYYFTFGTAAQYPEIARDGYVVVVAENWEKAVERFRRWCPDVHEGVINCAFFYSEEEWARNSRGYFSGKEPALVLFQDEEAILLGKGAAPWRA